MLLHQGREVAQTYQASGTPSAVLIRQDGTIGGPLVRWGQEKATLTR